ncbi:hypothetical protein F4775DRAFT_571928 [Biscogniauxia sp. FL1348]|nr:hypothetical protein F4775DRAFT_571928 [Biscogniauxia sp. FL1348]
MTITTTATTMAAPDAADFDQFVRLTEKFTLDNPKMLFAASMAFLIGYIQYYYVIRLTLREGQGPMPAWMHSFYLAHDSTWAYHLAAVAPRYGNHWFLRSTSTALLVWTMLEIFTLHRSATRERAATFGYLFHRGTTPPALGPVLAYLAITQAAMYAVVNLGIELMGPDCLMQWFCLTNVVMTLGPTHEYLSRGSRDGLALGFCLVNVFCAVFTFAPFGMWAVAVPEIFDRPAYYAVGVLMTAYSLWNFWIVASYPPKLQKKGGASPIW